MSKNQNSEYSEKIRPNSEVCKHIKEFIDSRKIIDPFVMQKIKPEPKGKDRDDLVKKLKNSYKQTENRFHPWMS